MKNNAQIIESKLDLVVSFSRSDADPWSHLPILRHPKVDLQPLRWATNWNPAPRNRYDRWAMAQTVLMCPPTFFDVREVKNPYMGRAIDRVRAQQQWENLRRSLEEAGMKVETIDPVPDLEDMVFAANQVFVGYHDKVGKFIVPSRMLHSSRQKEVPFYVDWFRKRGYTVIELDLAGEYLEGHGDLLWHPDQSKIWAAYGFRSTRGGVEKFAAAMQDLDIPVIALQLVDAHCYHLDTSLCPLNAESALINPDAFSRESLDALRAGWKRIHEISAQEAHQFMGNGIVANGRYITPGLTENLSKILALEGLTPVVVDTSEFEKSGGSAFCMKSFLA
jgi:N-dimethylarginine dimethylaminohydrolase